MVSFLTASIDFRHASHIGLGFWGFFEGTSINIPWTLQCSSPLLSLLSFWRRQLTGHRRFAIPLQAQPQERRLSELLAHEMRADSSAERPRYRRVSYCSFRSLPPNHKQKAVQTQLCVCQNSHSVTGSSDELWVLGNKPALIIQ